MYNSIQSQDLKGLRCDPPSKISFPIYFDRQNECVHCGDKGSLIFIDKFGKPTKQEIHAFHHIVCSKCGTKYEIFWKKDEDKMYPVAVDSSYREEFVQNALK